MQRQTAGNRITALILRGFRVSGFGVIGLKGLGFKGLSSGFRVEGFRFRVLVYVEGEGARRDPGVGDVIGFRAPCFLNPKP